MTEARTTMRRVVGRWQILGLALNDVVGSGVYLLPAAAAAMIGGLSVWAVFLAGLAVLLIVLCYAEASSHFDEPGGSYLYARTAFGSLVGFEVGWMLWITRVVVVASLSVGFAQALSYVVPAAGSGWTKHLIVAAPIIFLTVMNVIGIRSGVATSTTLVVGKLLPLGLFLAGGLLALSGADVVQPEPDQGRLAEAVLLLLFAYAGFENSPAAAGEYKRPKRDVPFALVANITLVTLLYAAVQLIAWKTVPDLRHSATPLADGAGQWFGAWAGVVLTVGAALSILGTTGNSILFGPRYLYALARDGYGPGLLARLHPGFRTPAAATIVQSAIALPLALSGSFAALAALSVVTRLAGYLTTAAAVPILRRKMPPSPGSFRLPGGPLIPAAAVGVSLVLAASAGRDNLLAAGIAVVVGLAIYFTRRRRS